MSFSFLADENIPRICVTKLREAGFDVSYIGETAASISDTEVCSMACSEHRIIITGDKDFGDLVMRLQIKVPGVILLQLKQLKPDEIASILLSTLQGTHAWENHFTVLTKDSIRIRKLTADQ
jgi:predicted nuclease of predicted toxin-antitoxin system